MRNGSLVYQVQKALEEKFTPGKSKHQAKINGTMENHIYSYKTLETYKQQCTGFVKYCRKAHKVQSLEDCRQYADEWLKTYSEASAWTQKLQRSALAKLYGCKAADFIKSADRQRERIKRSRNNNKHFSESNHANLVEFCRSTGLRRHELEHLKSSDLRFNDKGQAFVYVAQGKGGKARYVPVCGSQRLVIDTMKAAGDNQLVFDKIPQAMDIHKYRADYCGRVYQICARKEIPRKDRYYCRNDKKGVVYDKAAMRIASNALGHERISVIAGHYLIRS